MNGSTFQNFPEFEKFKKIFEKSAYFAQKFGPKLDRLVYKWVTFS